MSANRLSRKEIPSSKVALATGTSVQVNPFEKVPWVGSPAWGGAPLLKKLTSRPNKLIVCKDARKVIFFAPCAVR